MAKILFFFLFLASVSVFSNPTADLTKAKALFQEFFTEPAITEAFLSGFRKNKSEGFTKFYGAHEKDIQAIVKTNYSEALIQNGATIISDNLSTAEIDEVIKYYKSPIGNKTKEILMMQPTQKISDIATKAELAEIDNFHKAGAGKKWGSAYKLLSVSMRDPQNTFAKNTVAKLLEYFKSKQKGQPSAVNQRPVSESELINAKKLIKMFYIESTFINLFLNSFKKGMKEPSLSFYNSHLNEIQQIVRTNLMEPIYDAGASLVSSQMSATEMNEALSYLSSPAGQKVLENITTHAKKKPSEFLTKSEDAELERFLRSPAGTKWMAVVTQIKLNDPQLDQTTKNKLYSYFKSNGAEIRR